MVKLTEMEYDGTNDWKLIPGCTRFMASPHVHTSGNRTYQVINTNYDYLKRGEHIIHGNKVCYYKGGTN